MSSSSKTENINNSFFDGYYKDIWRNLFPEKTTLAEVDFIISEAGLQEGSRILDIMCGHGRHTIGLARRGFNVTAVDNLADYISEIKVKASEEKLNIESIHTDVMEISLSGKYDAVICMGNSFQFFEQGDLKKLFFTLASHLEKGGKLFINTWSIAEIVFKNFKDKTWGRMDDLLLLTESKVLFNPTRIETDSIIIAGSGEREEKKGIDYIYSIAELEIIFNITGFVLKDIYSIPGKKKFSLGEPRAYIVAEKL